MYTDVFMFLTDVDTEKDDTVDDTSDVDEVDSNAVWQAN